MARNPIKPPRKRAQQADLTPRRLVPQPQADATSDPVEGRMSDAGKGKKYVDHMMSLNKKYHGNKVRCYIYLQSYVSFERAEEWARYWQPRLGTPIGLVIQDTLDKVTIDHGTVDDPFPKREFDYPWKAEAVDFAQRNSRTWVNDATLRPQPESTSESAAAMPPGEPLQPATPPSQDSGAAQPATPRSMPSSPTVAVHATKVPPPRRMSEAQHLEQAKRDSAAIRGKAAPITPRRVTPTPPKHKRRT